MFRRVCTLAVAAALVAASATPFAQASVAGDWTLTINSPQGVIDTDASFTQDGDKVTGTFTSPMGETSVAGTMSGNTLTVAFNVVTQAGPIDIRMTADVTGSDMKGMLDYGQGTADFTGKKK